MSENPPPKPERTLPRCVFLRKVNTMSAGYVKRRERLGSPWIDDGSGLAVRTFPQLMAGQPGPPPITQHPETTA